MTLERRVDSLESQLSRLLQDERIGESLEGALPISDTFMGYRYRDGSRYYMAGVVGAVSANSAFNPTANKLWAVPLLVAEPVSVDRIACDVTTLAVGNARLGIYRDIGLYPGSLLLDSGAFNIGSSGFKTQTIGPSRLTRGLWWLAFLTEVAPVLNGVPASAAWNLLGHDATIGGYGIGWNVTQTYGVLPVIFPSGGAIQSTGPLIRVRAFS